MHNCKPKKPIGTSQETGEKAIWACHNRDRVWACPKRWGKSIWLTVCVTGAGTDTDEEKLEARIMLVTRAEFCQSVPALFGSFYVLL